MKLYAIRKKINDFIFKIKFEYIFLQKSHNIIIHDSKETLEYILNRQCSVSRYGDGEYYVMAGKGNSFQEPNQVLSKRLREILISNQPNHIVCLPITMKTVDYCTKEAANFWRKFFINNGEDWLNMCDKNKEYYDTQISRFYMDYKNKTNRAPFICLLKKVWEKKDIVIIEGEKTRMGIGNDLFNNSLSISRILTPAENAYDKYDKILNTIIEKTPKTSLILLAVGMTATVLAYDLANKGYQAIDIGHLDIEYEWFINKAITKEKIQGKAVNEAGNIAEVQECKNDLYKSQIIAII